MTIADLEYRLGCRPLTPYVDAPVTGAYTSDLLSDVVAHAPAGSVLITLQAHRNTVACAFQTGIRAIVLVGFLGVTDDLLEVAQAHQIAVFATQLRQFDLSWKVAGLLGLGL